MSFLKQILNPFIEFDEDKKKDEGAKQKPAPSPSHVNRHTSSPDANENVSHPLINTPGSVKDRADQTPAFAPSGTLAAPLPEHVQYFEKLINDANANNPMFRGADYKEFIDSKIDIDDIADEGLKYKTAFNILKSTGLTKDKLLQTGQEYLNLIGRDLNTFQGAHAIQYRKEVGQKEQQIQKKAEELQALQQRVNALKAEINTLTQETNITKDKLDTVKNSFLLAGEMKQNEIETELNKIAGYF
jgi:archaellum component FlaC